jgi:hypothetical protein
MGFIEKFEVIPREILVKKQEALDLLEPVASRLGIELRKLERLEMVDNAQLSMLQFFQ